MDMITLGMLIIDEIHFQDGNPPAIDVLGGAGSWAVFGARLFRKPPFSSRVGWVVHKGSDFPSKVIAEITSWNTTCRLVDTPERLTTRGWNEYGSNEKRAFRYTTEKIRIDETQLTDPMLRARCFHLICTPARCINLVEGIVARRSQLELSDRRPLFVWEPVPDSCGPEELANLMLALKHVDVVSPNHQELAELLRVNDAVLSDVQNDQNIPESSEVLRKGFEADKGAVIVRCGERGCYVSSQEFNGYLPAYHQPNKTSQSNVIDPTGAGNAFLGAYCIGLLDALKDPNQHKDHHRTGAIYGSIAAGCAVEQVGLPVLSSHDGSELWNGVSLEQRWEAYSRILSLHE